LSFYREDSSRNVFKWYRGRPSSGLPLSTEDIRGFLQPVHKDTKIVSTLKCLSTTNSKDVTILFLNTIIKANEKLSGWVRARAALVGFGEEKISYP
jgi:hypothetical protein